MKLSDYYKLRKTESYAKMAERINEYYTGQPDQHVTEYKVNRVLNDKPTSGELRVMAKICRVCYDVHISELLQPLMNIQPSTFVSSRRETVNGIEGTHVFYRKKV